MQACKSRKSGIFTFSFSFFYLVSTYIKYYYYTLYSLLLLLSHPEIPQLLIGMYKSLLQSRLQSVSCQSHKQCAKFRAALRNYMFSM